MKKLICLTLALLLTVLALPVIPAAAEAPGFLRLDYCDNCSNFVNGSYPTTAIATDGEHYTDAPAGVKMSGDLNKGSSFVFYMFPGRHVVDISPYRYFEFDLYTTDKDLFHAGTGQMELSSSGKCDVAELGFGFGVIANCINTDGWNHVKVDLTRGGKNSTDPSQVFDPTKVNFFRMYLTGINRTKKDFSFTVDNMYFSDGVTKPDDGPKKSDYQPADAYAGDDSPGDCTGDGLVNAEDALAALKYAVDKTDLTNRQLACAETDGDGAVNASDALLMLKKAVKKINRFPNQPTPVSRKVEVGINTPHLVHTQYPTDTAVIAETDVIYWGARGDGVTDDTLAFSKAIAAADGRGGGTVFVPSGRFAIRGTLQIPNGVTLQGDAPKADAAKPVEGTVLMAYAGRGNANGTPFITTDSSAAIANLSIWYPEQTPDAITPYPYTIRQGQQYGIALTNLRLVNSYRGICMAPNVNALQNIRGVVGTALDMGLILDYNVDICRVEDVIFTPACWKNSGLTTATDSAWRGMENHLYQNATAFQFESIDWTYLTDLTAEGYHVGMVNSKPTLREATGSPNGHIYGFRFDRCDIGYDARNVNVIGMMLTNGEINARIPVQTSTEYNASISLYDVTMNASGPAAILQKGSGTIMMENCRVLAPDGDGVQVNSGNLTATKTVFSSGKTGSDVKIGEKAGKILLTNCTGGNGTPSLGGSTQKATVTNNKNLKSASFDKNAYDHHDPAVTRPRGDAFVDLTAAPYGVTPGSTQDISGQLQTALSDVEAAGGGVVYLPSGTYHVEKAILIPTGVELRGSCTFPQHSHAYSTTIYTDFGKSGNAFSQALFTLRPFAGLAGIKVYYDRMPIGTSYAYTVRGTGANDYLLNCDFLNSYLMVDLDTYRCDGHYVNGVTGYPLYLGIVVGGNSRNGVVRDCQFNIHFFTDNPTYRTGAVDGDKARIYATDYCEAYVVRVTHHELMFQNFVLGVHSGLATETGADVFVLAHGTDGGDRSVSFRGTPRRVDLVNSQLVVIGPGSTKAYINMETTFDGTVNMVQTNMWGQPMNYTALVNGGTLLMSLGTNIRHGTYGYGVSNEANLYVDTMFSYRGDPYCDYDLSNAGQVETYGNIYTSGGLLRDPYDEYDGFETLKKR